MLSRQFITTFFATIALFVAMSCGQNATSSSSAAIENQTDSLSYVVGMNIAYNIMQMDSTINPAAVVRGINDVLSNQEILSIDEARTYFLAYMNFGIYERVKKYEEQYLADLAKSDKEIVRTQSGLTYKVGELGNMNRVATRDRDSVIISYRATRLSGEEVDLAANRDETLRETLGKLVPGLREGVKLVGAGGKITLWIPSELAYGSAGSEEKGIKPNELLRYEVEIKEVKK